MQYLPEFLTVITIHILGVMLPGPDFVLVTRNSLIYSRRGAVLTALGIAAGNITHVSYALLGIAYVVERSIIAFSVMKFFGAAYLIYLGLKALLAKNNPKPTAIEQSFAASSTISGWQAVRNGFICNALNPKCALFFLSIFTQVISPGTPASVQAFYGVSMILTAFAWFAIVAIVFSHGAVKIRFAPIQHRLEKFFGVILVALGIKVVLSK